MHSTTYQKAAIELLHRRVAGTKAACLPVENRPQNIEDALQIQAHMILQHSADVAGWKCLLPLAEDQLIVGPIFSDGIQQGATCEQFAENSAARVEPEIAFVLGQDLPANANGYSEAEIDQAIGSCHMALELIQLRYADDSDAQFVDKLADGLVNQGLYIGPEIDRNSAFAASSFGVSIAQGESTQTFVGNHPNQEPVAPIYWLINYMTRRGVDFTAGEALITGSYCGVVDVAFNQLTTITYEGIGEYQVTFVEKS